MSDAPSSSRQSWREAVVQRAQDTGDPSPAFTMTLVLGFVIVATSMLVPTILAGSIASVLGLVTIALMLNLLPSLFASAHGRYAAVSRVAGFAVLLVIVVTLGFHLWG